MDTSSNAGKPGASGKLFSHADLFGFCPTYDFERAWNRTDIEGIPYFETEGFAALAKAISKGSRTIETAILRRWRIRR